MFRKLAGRVAASAPHSFEVSALLMQLTQIAGWIGVIM